MIDSFLIKIENQLQSQLPFVAYRKPNDNRINAILQNNTNLHLTKTFKERGFVFSPFNADNDSVVIPLEQAELINTYWQKDAVLDTSHHNLKFNDPEVDKIQHVNLVEKGIEAISTGAFKKVVLSRRETLRNIPANPLGIFKSLLTTYPLAFVYCWYHPKVGMWLGATPETLLKIKGHSFSIMALAGTQNYKGTLNVTWQAKEQQEQQFVTDFILEQIKGVVTNISLSNVETVRAGNLLHLRTLIKGNLPQSKIGLKALLHSLHPTPAVCGLPKAKAKAFILENENYDRSFYTGFLGELNFEKDAKPVTSSRNIEHRAYSTKIKSTQLYVNLRCMQLIGNNAYVYVGGGITETSNPEAEWEETVAKSMVIKNVLQ